MRTRHILTALALPALFAACTADEFETVGHQDNGLQERPKLSEDFTLMTSGIQTRYAVEGSAGISFNFEKGDRIGAAIIDEYVPDKEPEDFKVIYSLAGNNPFDYQGNDQWTSNTQLGIGHYLFVYRYNPADNTRGAVSYELPVVQEMYTNENGEQVLNAAVEAGNKAVAAAVLHEGETVADISLKNLFTYPKLTINFDNGEKVTTVSQIVLKAKGAEKFLVKGGFNHKVVAEMFNPSEKAGTILDGTYYDNWNNSPVAYVDWDKVGTKDFLINESDEDYEKARGFTKMETSDYIIVKFPNNTKVKLNSITNNKYVEARIMMPSIENFTEDKNIELYVYTDNGIYHMPFYADYENGSPAKDCSFTFGAKTTKDDVVSALKRNTSNGLQTRALNAIDRTTEVDNIVTTIEDWNNLVDLYGDSKNAQDIAIVGEDFAFDETAKWPTECVFTIKTSVAVKGDVEIKNVKVDDEEEGTEAVITVEEGATLTVGNTLVAEKIANEGIVNIVAKRVNNATYTGVKAIENKSELNVAENADATFELTNQKGATVTNEGTMVVSGENDGTITNNSLMTTGNFENKDPEVENNVIVNLPTITNAKDARILAEGKLMNKGSIVNEGTLTCRNTTNGEITNIYMLDSKKGAITYITKNADNTTEGYVVVYEANPTDVTIANRENAEGFVMYTAVNSEEDFTNSLVNYVTATKSLSINGALEKGLAFEGTTGTLKLEEADKSGTPAAGSIASLTVTSGTLTIGSDVEVEALKVEKGAQLTIPAKQTLTLNADNLENEGRILVGGTFNAEQVLSNKGGLVENNGGEINWAPTTDEQNKAAYETALKAMVDKWMLNDARKTWEAVAEIKSSGNWTSDGWSTLAETAMKAYNTWTGDNYTEIADFQNNILFKDAKTHEMIDAIISGYKTNSEADVKAAFNAKYPDNTWITKNGNGAQDYGVFRKLTEDTELAEIKTDKNSVMIGYFANNAVEIQLSEVNVSTDDDANVKQVENKAVWLTLQSLNDEVEGVKYANVKDAYIPDYSYVCLYEGAGEYDIMKDVKKLYTQLSSAQWLTSQGITEDDLKKIEGVKKFVSAVKDAKEDKIDGVSSYDKQLITDSGLADKFNTVWAWKYTDKQIEYLYNKVK